MDFNTYVLLWICVIGLCLGSFYNVVILRSLSGESIVFPPSKCPKCNHKLYPWHNIPVLSYLFLRGKCYFCKEHISLQYPTIEFVTMILFGASFLKYGYNYTTIFVIFWLSCLLIMTVTDIKEKVVDCNIAIIAGISGLIFNYISGGLNGAAYSIAGAIAGIIIMELIARIGYLIVKTRAMGEADTYVAASLGAIVGIYGIVKLLLISLLASMLFIVPIFLYRKYKANDKMTCLFSILFTISAITFYFNEQNIYTLIFLLLSGIGLIYFILKGLKNIEHNSYLPYVPALGSAALYYIFAIGI